ncbi:glycosyltransferase [uncultured Polaribacter sp.]|uniref:glycosyltransferase family 2 protein n=1 Tax=uncultured Polaribacter sp. TaxID=174711 RepID=UPI002635569C|nr:glycosyltransferase [uncultured Polaribacter sp.]
MIWVFVFLFSVYAVLIISLTIGFYKIEEFYAENTTFKTRFSVIIPFRNEAENLPNLLNSIAALKYPKELVEFIFVDDDSTDASVAKIQQILNKFQIDNSQNLKPLDCARGDIHIIKNKRTSNSPKKDAISTAIQMAKNNWILTTDADCIVSENWLKALDRFIQKSNPKMVVAPVNYIAKNNFLEQFQLLDFMSLQGTTIGGFGMNFPFLCNGANLAYRKDIFLKLNGFKGNDTIASGDDIFLFEKFLEDDKNGVHFLKSKEAIVSTFPVKSTSALIQQRIRWVSKTSKFKSTRVKLIGLLVFLVNLYVVFNVFFYDNIASIFLPLVLKISIDLFLFIPTINFYNHKKTFFKWYVFSGIIYPFFSVCIVFKSFFYKYNWKGRNFKK